jgi:NAD(P)-dependent dehydrogenase (short-subunit alcohol dehydrogenase family)
MLNDRVALATGGDIGIGKAIGVQLTQNGSKVALASRNPAHLESAAAELRALGFEYP